MRKVIVEIKLKAIINVDDDIEISEIIDELDYDISDTTTKATIEDTEIIDYEIIDSK